VLTFDKPLDPVRAQDPANYQLVALDGSGRTIGIQSAVYDPATQTVTLRPVHQLDLFHRFGLRVVGTGFKGLADSSGNLLDGRKNGRSGSDFVTVISAANLVLTPAESKKPGLRREIKTLAATYRGLAQRIPVATVRPGREGDSSTPDSGLPRRAEYGARARNRQELRTPASSRVIGLRP
jgi:hypothetical protein